MSNVLANFIDTVVPESRRGILHHADNVLISVGHRTHHIAVENLISQADEMETVDLIDQAEGAIVNSMIDQISEYGIGIKERNLGTITAIFTGLTDIIGYSDQQAILDICDQDDLPEESLSDILALVYNDDSERYVQVLDYVLPSLIQRVIANASQFVDEMDLESDEDEVQMVDDQSNDILPGETGVGEQTRAIVKDFVNRHHPEKFIGMVHNGAQLGYSLATYLNQTILGDETNPETIAKEYFASALASGESPMTAVQKASDRLEVRVADIHLLQRVLQVLRSYLSEGKAG
jgi:hypothetical protein